MGKVSKFAATAGVILAVAGGVASADVSNTGPNSTNTETNTSNSNIVCINDNVISGSNSSSQSSSSGNASSSGNTSSGGSSSGNASNSNSSSVTVSVNGNCPGGTTPVPANSQAAQAAAAGQTNLVFNSAGVLVSSSQPLPETGTNDTIKMAIVTVAIIGLAAAVSQFGFSTYRRSLKS